MYVIPQAIEAEQSVLGAMMMMPETIDRACEVLDEDDFYRPEHRLIWRAIVQLSNKGLPVDPICLGEWFRVNDWDGLIRGSAYLVEICNSTPSASNIQAHAAIVREKSVLRQLMSMAEAISNDCQAASSTAKDILERIETRLLSITEASSRDGEEGTSMRSACSDALRTLTDRYRSGSVLLGLPTGLSALDEATGGLCAGQLIILAARDGMGKTTLAMNICQHVALKEKQPVLIFSPQQEANELASRMIASTGIIDHSRIHRGLLEESDWLRVSNAISLLSASKIVIDDSSDLSAIKLAYRARRAHRDQGNLGLIVLDDLQGMYPDVAEGHHAEKLRALCRTLKALAKELDVPVMALSQLSHSVDLRPNKRPVLMDLSAYGGIQSHADQVLFLYRDELYHNHSTDKGIAEVIIGKQRNGPAGIVRLRFLEQRLHFESEPCPPPMCVFR